MHCRVLYFAGLAELTGRREETIELAAGALVGDAIEAIGRRHRAVSAQLGSAAAAMDERYVARDTALTDGCTLALIPPVSGG